MTKKPASPIVIRDPYGRRKPFIVTHVRPLSGPAAGQVFGADQLPEGYALKPTWGDCFLLYQGVATIRHLFQQLGKNRWLRWPHMDKVSPYKDPEPVDYQPLPEPTPKDRQEQAHLEATARGITASFLALTGR